MKKNMTNAEIEGCLKILNSPDSFRGNMAIKIPGNLDWNLRINIKALASAFETFSEARNDIGKRYIDSGKTEGEHVKEEYLGEYILEMQELASQENELNFRPLKVEEIFKIENLSGPERDALIMMCSDEDIEMQFTPEDEKESEITHEEE